MIEQRIQRRRPLWIGQAAGALERRDRGFGKRRRGAEHECHAQNNRPGGTARQIEADVFAERHQAVLRAFDKQHEADNHREDAERDRLRPGNRRIQNDGVEQRQKQCERHHAFELLDETHAHVGREQPVEIYCAQPLTPGQRRMFGGNDVIEVDNALPRAHRTQIFAVADGSLHVPDQLHSAARRGVARRQSERNIVVHVVERCAAALFCGRLDSAGRGGCRCRLRLTTRHRI